MTAAMETLDAGELALDALLEHSPTTAKLRAPRAKSHQATPRKAAEERWCSTLEARDLRCLLSVIEEQVLPQMLRDYSPARCAAVPLSDSAP